MINHKEVYFKLIKKSTTKYFQDFYEVRDFYNNKVYYLGSDKNCSEYCSRKKLIIKQKEI